MGRTRISTSTLGSRAGSTPVFIPPDTGNNHDWVNTGTEKVLVVTGSPGGVTLTFRSTTDEHGRSDVETPIAQGAQKTTFYGPFTPPTIWGNGSGLGYLDVSAVSGSVSIAVVRN